MKLIITSFAVIFATVALGKEVAKINGNSYTDTMFKDALDSLGAQGEMVKKNPQVRQQFLDHLINNQLLSLEAEKNRMNKSKAFNQKMQSARQEILAQMFLQSQLEQATTDTKLESYFNSHKSEFSNTQVRASHILMDSSDKTAAEKVLKKALDPKADFAALAKEHSTGPTGPKGGDLNFFSRGQMVPDFEKVAFSTPVNSVHPRLVKSKFGFHIIKVTDFKKGKDAQFKEKRAEILRKVKRQVKEQLIKNLREKAKVTVDTAVLEKLQI